MFLDASALTAMLVDERDARELLARMQNYTVRTTSPLAVLETVLAVAWVLGLDIKTANTAVEEFLVLAGVDVEPVPADARRSAIDAFDRFGKGRHPAALRPRRVERGLGALADDRWLKFRHGAEHTERKAALGSGRVDRLSERSQPDASGHQPAVA